MRLGQLARQLNVSPKEIIRKLEKDFDTEIKSHPNAKIPDELLESISKAFGQTEAEIATEESVETPSPDVDKKPDTIQKLVEIVESVESVEQAQEEPPPPPSKVKLEIPSLDGPKIVGKIQLPEAELNRATEKREERPTRPKRHKKRPLEDKKRNRKAQKNESLEEKIKREQKKLEGQRKKSAESLKDFNKKKYEEKNKNKTVVKPKSKKKTKKKKVEAIRTQHSSTKANVKKAKPTTLVGKLWSWLNDA